MQPRRMDMNALDNRNLSKESNTIAYSATKYHPENSAPSFNQLDLPMQQSRQDPPRGRSETMRGIEHRSESTASKYVANKESRESAETSERFVPDKIKTEDNRACAMPRNPARKAFGRVDRSRAPLKKRPTSPMPPPTRPLTTQTSAGHRYTPVLPAPFLRQASSTFSIYKHHDMVPTPLCLTSSRGQQLISEPLLETPTSARLSWLPHSGGSHVGTNMAAHVLSGALSYHDYVFKTPGTDVVTKQVAIEHPILPNRSTSDKGYATTTEHQKAPPTKVSFSSKSQGDCLTPTPQYGFRYNILPTAPRHMVFSDGMRFHSHGVPARTNDSAPFSLNDPHFNHAASVGRNLFTNVPLTNRPCKCSHSRCLKLYCECFHYGYFCDEKLCHCRGCFNNEEHSEPRGDREIAIKKILARRPDAFRFKVKRRAGKGCGCKKSGCLKKYCECVALGKTCSDSTCKCTNCRNRGDALPSGMPKDESSAGVSADEMVEKVN